MPLQYWTGATSCTPFWGRTWIFCVRPSSMSAAVECLLSQVCQIFDSSVNTRDVIPDTNAAARPRERSTSLAHFQKRCCPGSAPLRLASDALFWRCRRWLSGCATEGTCVQTAPCATVCAITVIRPVRVIDYLYAFVDRN